MSRFGTFVLTRAKNKVAMSNIDHAEGSQPDQHVWLAHDPWEVEMNLFIHQENIALYERLIAESELDSTRNEERHKMLLSLLAEEKAKVIESPKV
jgi:hypothetical protein